MEQTRLVQGDHVEVQWPYGNDPRVGEVVEVMTEQPNGRGDVTGCFIVLWDEGGVDYEFFIAPDGEWYDADEHDVKVTIKIVEG